MRKARRRRTYRRNAYTGAVAAFNPRKRRKASRRRSFAANPPARRRHVFAKARRRTFRRNPPDILGFNLKDVAYAGAAVVAAPFVEKQVMALLPASMAGTQSGRWIVKVGSAVVIGYGAKRFLGTQAGNLALVALGANLIADAVSEFVPTLGYYPPVGLGQYTDRPFSHPALLTPGVQLRGYTGVYPSMTDPVNSDAYAPQF